MLPEERAREKIDKQLTTAGWDIVSRDEYVPQSASAVKEALMLGNTEKTRSARKYSSRLRIMPAIRRTGMDCGSQARSRWSTLRTGEKSTSKICCSRTVTI